MRRFFPFAALIGVALVLGCQDLGSGPVGPDGPGPAFAKGGEKGKPGGGGGGGEVAGFLTLTGGIVTTDLPVILSGSFAAQDKAFDQDITMNFPYFYDATTAENLPKRPVLVSGGLSFASVSTAFSETCGVTTGGDAYCWGENFHGRTQSNHSHGDAVATHITSAAFKGDVAIVLYGVPDEFASASYPQPYGLWDVTHPNNPTFLGVLNLGSSSHAIEAGSLGDKPYDATAVAGNYVYAIYNKSQTNGPTFQRTGFDDHLAVVDISDPRNPVVVGDWQDDPGAWLAGVSLNESATRAYVTGFTGRSPDWVGNGYLFVLDIQNPSQPTELGRYVFPSREVDVSIARPTSDDALVVLADHSWEDGKCGILHILDTSNPAEITEISSFALPESSGNCSTIATDVAIRGNLVFSTWLRGGVRVIDISDPTNPVQVARFRSPSYQGLDLSDVALLGTDFVVATTVWGSGMYILSMP